MNSKPSSTMPSKPVPKWSVVFFLALSFTGFIDAVYLTAAHYAQIAVPCSVTQGCEKVLTSSYATVGSVPVALLGALYYLALFILGIMYVDAKNNKVLEIAANLTWLGFTASLVFAYVQLFILHAICLYCMGSALTSTALFIIGLVLKRRLRGSQNVF